MSQFLHGSNLENSINLDKPSSYGLGMLVDCFFENGGWDAFAEDLTRPVIEALPPLKNGRKVPRRL